jgi:hypothetical protein
MYKQLWVANHEFVEINRWQGSIRNDAAFTVDCSYKAQSALCNWPIGQSALAVVWAFESGQDSRSSLRSLFPAQARVHGMTRPKGRVRHRQPTGSWSAHTGSFEHSLMRSRALRTKAGTRLAAVVKPLAKWVGAFNRGDADEIADFYAENAVNYQIVQEPVRGRTAVLNANLVTLNSILIALFRIQIISIASRYNWVTINKPRPL